MKTRWWKLPGCLTKKKVGEEFTILHQDEKYKACFTAYGLRVHGMSIEFWDGVLIGLLVGDHTRIVEQ